MGFYQFDNNLSNGSWLNKLELKQRISFIVVTAILYLVDSRPVIWNNGCCSAADSIQRQSTREGLWILWIILFCQKLQKYKCFWIVWNFVLYFVWIWNTEFLKSHIRIYQRDFTLDREQKASLKYHQITDNLMLYLGIDCFPIVLHVSLSFILNH